MEEGSVNSLTPIFLEKGYKRTLHITGKEQHWFQLWNGLLHAALVLKMLHPISVYSLHDFMEIFLSFSRVTLAFEGGIHCHNYSCCQCIHSFVHSNLVSYPGISSRPVPPNSRWQSAASSPRRCSEELCAGSHADTWPGRMDTDTSLMGIIWDQIPFYTTNHQHLIKPVNLLKMSIQILQQSEVFKVSADLKAIIDRLPKSTMLSIMAFRHLDCQYSTRLCF